MSLSPTRVASEPAKVATSVTETLPSARTYEYRIRARDKVGNRGLWAVIKVRV